MFYFQCTCRLHHRRSYSDYDPQECGAPGAGRDESADDPPAGPSDYRHLGGCWRGGSGASAGSVIDLRFGKREFSGVLLGFFSGAGLMGQDAMLLVTGKLMTSVSVELTIQHNQRPKVTAQ